jgi:predicted nucleic acid-binding protein
VDQATDLPEGTVLNLVADDEGDELDTDRARCLVAGASRGLVARSPSSRLELHGRTQLSWYDALIVAAALEAGCETLYSEDLQDGRQFGDVTVHNPFA